MPYSFNYSNSITCILCKFDYMKWLVILILIALSGFNLLCDDNGDIEEEQESEKSEIGSNAGSECSFNGFNS